MPPKRRLKIKRNDVLKIENNPVSLVEERKYFKNPKLISDHLNCSICQEVFEDPLRLHCGHSFCTKCVEQWFKTNSSCPIDRIKINKNNCHKDFLTANIIGDLEIACPWRPFGCNRLDKYCLIKYHKENCDYNINKMDPVIQEKLLVDYKASSFDSPNINSTKIYRSSSSVSKKPTDDFNFTSKTKMSALDWLMSQNHSDDEVGSNVSGNFGANDSMSNLPQEVEVPPLSMRLYLSANEQQRDVMKAIFKK